MLTDPNRSRTKLQERSLALMTEALERERIFTDAWSRARAIVPEDWHFHEQDAPCTPRKTKVTVRLDADMVRWFRHLGCGHQNRMNVALRAYMNAVIAKYVESEGDRDATGKAI